MSQSPNRRLRREAVDICLRYFNSGRRGSKELTRLIKRSENWCRKFYGDYKYGASRPTTLLKGHPYLFNLRIEPHLRLQTRKELRVAAGFAKPLAINVILHYKSSWVDPFPLFVDPTKISDEEMEEITDVRPSRACKAKPMMRVDINDLRNSRVMSAVPDFISQLARANLDLETDAAVQDKANRFELDESSAAVRPHIEMNLFAGVVEEQPELGNIVVRVKDEPDDYYDSDSTSSSSSSSTGSISSAASTTPVAVKLRKSSSVATRARDTPTPPPAARLGLSRRTTTSSGASGSDGDDESSGASAKDDGKAKSESEAPPRRIIMVKVPKRNPPAGRSNDSDQPIPSLSSTSLATSSSSASSPQSIGITLAGKRSLSEENSGADGAKRRKLIEELD